MSLPYVHCRQPTAFSPKENLLVNDRHIFSPFLQPNARKFEASNTAAQNGAMRLGEQDDRSNSRWRGSRPLFGCPPFVDVSENAVRGPRIRRDRQRRNRLPLAWLHPVLFQRARVDAVPLFACPDLL